MVPRRGLEPPRPCERQHLKLVRLPIPPSGHGWCGPSAAPGRRGPIRAANGLVNQDVNRGLNQRISGHCPSTCTAARSMVAHARMLK